MAAPAKKVVLAVVDSLKPEMLDLAIEEGHAPALAALRERGTYVRDCLSTFPSVTPVASAAIATGAGPGEHHIPSMNWYHRGEERYVEYGSSFPATRAFGVVRSLYDTVYNMNMAHLSRARKTVFEHLDDAGLRTACTTWLIYRGRTRHDPSGRASTGASPRQPSFTTPSTARGSCSTRICSTRATRGAPRLWACSASAIVTRRASAPTWWSTTCSTSCCSRCPTTTPTPIGRALTGNCPSIAEADRALERILQVAGGVDEFLERYAVIVMSDHSQTKVDERVNLADVFAAWNVLTPADPAPTDAEVALCPAARSASLYVLDERRAPELVPKAVAALLEMEGADLAVTAEEDRVVVRSSAGELRMPPAAGCGPRRPQLEHRRR